MALVTDTRDLKYTALGVPFIGSPLKSAIDCRGLKYSALGVPFIANQGVVSGGGGGGGSTQVFILDGDFF